MRERTRVAALLRLVTESRRAEGDGDGAYGPTLAVIDAYVQGLVVGLKQCRERHALLVAALEAQEQGQGQEEGDKAEAVPWLRMHAGLGLTRAERAAALSQSLGFLMELARDPEALAWYEQNAPAADNGPTLALLADGGALSRGARASSSCTSSRSRTRSRRRRTTGAAAGNDAGGGGWDG